MIQTTEQVIGSVGKSVLAANHQKAIRMKATMKAEGQLSLEWLREIGVYEVSAKDKVIVRNWSVPDDVVLDPFDSL